MVGLRLLPFRSHLRIPGPGGRGRLVVGVGVLVVGVGVVGIVIVVGVVVVVVRIGVYCSSDSLEEDCHTLPQAALSRFPLLLSWSFRLSLSLSHPALPFFPILFFPPLCFSIFCPCGNLSAVSWFVLSFFNLLVSLLLLTFCGFSVQQKSPRSFKCECIMNEERDACFSRFTVPRIPQNPH